MPQGPDSTPPSAPRPSANLQARINRLFEAHHPPRALQREYRNREVVDACKAAGLEISESHLSELRRGVKTRTTLRILEAIAWFFQVRVSYLVDHDVTDQEAELAAREAQLNAKLAAERRDREDLAEAARRLRQAVSSSGVTNMAHRATTKGMSYRETAEMMDALTRIISAADDDE